MLPRATVSPRYEGERAPPLPEDPDATLRVTIALGWVALGASVGIPMGELMAAAGLTPDRVGDPDATIPVGAAVALVRRVEEALPGEILAARLLDLMPPSAWGLVDLTSQSSATVGDAIEVYLRYTRLTSSAYQGWIERRGEYVAIRSRHLPSLETLAHPMEVSIWHGQRLLQRRGAAPRDIVEAHLGHAPIGPAEQYAELLGFPVHFESFGTALVLRAEALKRPNVHRDPVLARSLLARLEADLNQSEDPRAALLRELAAHAKPAQYTASQIAGRMGRSLRSLQRDAAGLGTTLRELIDELRVARAQQLLRDNSLSIDEVGFLLDYSERAAFSRAFKRSTGLTPAEFRRGGGN